MRVSVILSFSVKATIYQFEVIAKIFSLGYAQLKLRHQCGFGGSYYDFLQ